MQKQTKMIFLRRKFKTWVGKLLVFYPAQQLSLETTSPNATIKLKVDGWLSVVFFPETN
jgi:hypothetical protein